MVFYEIVDKYYTNIVLDFFVMKIKSCFMGGKKELILEFFERKDEYFQGRRKKLKCLE